MKFILRCISCAAFLLVCIPGTILAGDSIVEEPIIVGINQSGADAISNWQEKARKVVEKTSDIFRKTTPKKFKVLKYLVYPDKEYTEIFTKPEKHPEFYHEWNGVGGVTYLILITDGHIGNKKIIELYGSDTVNVMNPVSYNQRQYPFILESVDREKNFLDEGGPSILTHELGHAQGLASPDWYLYEFSDLTDVDPRFSDYSVHLDDRYAMDPMVSHTPASVSQFGNLNSAILNRNLDRKITFSDIQDHWYAKKTKILVVDEGGMPVSGARVQVYGVLRGCWYCKDTGELPISTSAQYTHGVTIRPGMEQQVTTDTQGYASINGPTSAWVFGEENGLGPYVAKAVKVFANGLSSVATISFLDLQQEYVLYNKEEFILKIVLGKTEQPLKVLRADPKPLSGGRLAFHWETNKPISRVDIAFMQQSRDGIGYSATDFEAPTRFSVSGTQGEVVVEGLEMNNTYWYVFRAIDDKNMIVNFPDSFGAAIYISPLSIMINKGDDGKTSNAKAVIYKNPKTKKRYMVSVSDAFHIFAKQADTVTSRQLGILKQKKDTPTRKALLKKYKHKFIKIDSERKKIWYVNPSTPRVSYFDQTEASFDHLVKELGY